MWFYLHKEFPGGDLVENGCFIEVKLANVCRFSDFARGTMREKMAIFKERNRVCRGPKFSIEGDVDENQQDEDNFIVHWKCWWNRVALTRSKRSGRCTWKMKHVLNMLTFNTWFNGSDVDENRHFIERKVLAHGQILFCDIYFWMEIIL